MALGYNRYSSDKYQCQKKKDTMSTKQKIEQMVLKKEIPHFWVFAFIYFKITLVLNIVASSLKKCCKFT